MISRNMDICRTCTSIFDYDAQTKQPLVECSLCGSKSSVVVSKRDRYGYNAVFNLCKGCGVIYLSPRMSKALYAQFYSQSYRKVVSVFLGRKVDEKSIQEEQHGYSCSLWSWLESQSDCFPKGTIDILDVGGSTGVVSRNISQHCGSLGMEVNVTVLDPSEKELAVAEAAGMNTIKGVIEDFRGQEASRKKWNFVMLCQTIDHLLDVRTVLEMIREIMTEDGLFFVDIVDWRQVCQKRGLQNSLKVDHPYNFTPEVVVPLLEIVGFRIVSEARLYDGHLIGYLCKKAEIKSGSFDAAHAARLLKEVRETW